jgi:PKD domain/Secretion system C-terminal sorting domain
VIGTNSGGFVWEDGVSASVFSPDGNWFADQDVIHGLQLFRFDRCSGTLSSAQFITKPTVLGTGGGVAFSSNSKFVYIDGDDYAIVGGPGTNHKYVFQYDLAASDINASITTIADVYGHDTIPPTGEFQVWMYDMVLMRNGKIFIIKTQSGPWTDFYIHTIERPNEKGADCRFKLNNIHLKRDPSAMGTFPNFRLGPIDGSSCDTLGLDNHPYADYLYEIIDTINRKVEFVDNSAYQPTTWHWDFGDGTTSQDTSPVHFYQNDGVFNVCLTVCNQFSCDTFCQLVFIGVTSTENLQTLMGLNISPNPASEKLKIALLEDFKSIGKHQISLVNVLGQTLKTQNFQTNQTEIDVSNLPNGLIYVQILENGKIKAVGKAVIAH